MGFNSASQKRKKQTLSIFSSTVMDMDFQLNIELQDVFSVSAVC